MQEIVWRKKWEYFKEELPFRQLPYSKRNWGNSLHSLCSFYGKLKPALAHHLIETFVPENGRLLDCFSGSGTVPFEGALLGRTTYGFDIDPVALVLSKAKVGIQSFSGCQNIINELQSYIKSTKINNSTLEIHSSFGYNKTLKEYYHHDTFNEILCAREFFINYQSKDDDYYLVLAAMLHILHGNRPYALSRRSHPITPYAPSGNYQYKSVVEKLLNKVNKSLYVSKDNGFVRGEIFENNILGVWNSSVDNLDAIITSPPFFESTRFYLTNWLRNWFLGWVKDDFEAAKINYVEEIQKKNFDIYLDIFLKSKERLKSSGVMVFHLGKSKRKNMGIELSDMAKKVFNSVELFHEDVTLVEKHGIRDKGAVNSHQYLVAFK